MQTDKQSLLRILKEKSISYGDFILSSGKTSKYYIDVRLTTFDQEGVVLAGKLVLEIIKSTKKKITAVGGLTMGADPIAISTIITASAENFPLKGFSVRKEPKSHGTRKRIEGNLDVSDRVVILEDVITTGGSTISAINAVTEFGAHIEMVIALVDRCEGGADKIREMGYDIQALFTVSDLLDPAKLT
jgi:orotate phosphoribosyltransferase